nr:retrotransposon protein, putative, Ty1-copia subclass [Tanacetum cinerariifolium]
MRRVVEENGRMHKHMELKRRSGHPMGKELSTTFIFGPEVENEHKYAVLANKYGTLFTIPKKVITTSGTPRETYTITGEGEPVNPGEPHWTAVKTILKNLRNIIDMFLVYGGNPEAEFKVTCYCDARFETDSDVIKSQIQAEYIVALKATMEAVWIRKFILGLGGENPIRTLGDYSKPSHKGYRNTIELPVGNNMSPLQSDTIRIHHHLEGSYYPIPCSIRSTGKDRKTPQCYPDVPTTSWRISIRSMDSDFAKPVKGITLPQDVLSTSDHRLIELETQVQRLMEAHLASTQPTQVNKITTSCKICNGPMTLSIAWKTPNKPLLTTHPRVPMKQENDGEVMFIEIIRDDDEPQNESLNEGNFTYVVDFMIVEDISSIIDPRLSQVVLGRLFIEVSNMTHDLPGGVVRFTNENDEVAFKMPHKIEQYNSLLNLEKEHTKSVYLRNEGGKRRGVVYVMSKILGFYKEYIKLGPEYVTGLDDEGEVT